MIADDVKTELVRLQDENYCDFMRKVIPTVAPETVIGIRTPALRKLAGELAKRPDAEVFLTSLPHEYFEENQLHAFMLSGMKDFARCMELVCTFLPYVDNWATCDQMSPKCFGKHKTELSEQIRLWIASGETYTVRFAIGMLMTHFLDADFNGDCLETVAAVRSDAYYVNMMVAWFFATALAKQYDAALPYLTDRRLDAWTHNKTIQKAIESYRISPDKKVFLRGLKIR